MLRPRPRHCDAATWGSHVILKPESSDVGDTCGEYYLSSEMTEQGMVWYATFRCILLYRGSAKRPESLGLDHRTAAGRPARRFFVRKQLAHRSS